MAPLALAAQPRLLGKAPARAALSRRPVRIAALRAEPLRHVAPGKPKHQLGWLRQQSRAVGCAGSPKEDEAETLTVVAVVEEEPAEAEEAIPYPSDEEVENNPELHPLKEALQRAQTRRDEATGIREALEAEAQEVAQLAVNAQEAWEGIKAQLEARTSDLAAAVQAEAAAKGTLEKVKQRMQEQEAADEEAQRKVASGAVEAEGTAAAEAGAESNGKAKEGEEKGVSPTGTIDLDEGEDGRCEVVVGRAALEDLLWQWTKEVEVASSKVVSLREQVAMLVGKAKTAEGAFLKAEEVASAAMEAAEEAVRDEMECIAVTKETETALLKAIEDLRALDESSERQEESRKRTQKGGKAAAKAIQAVEEEFVLPPPAAGPAAAEPKTSERKSERKAERKPFKVVEEEEPSPVRTALALAAKHKFALLGVAVALVAGGVALQESGALALISAKLQAAWTGVVQLWGVASALVKSLPWPHIHDSEKGLLQAMQLLLASVFAVPLICKLPGGSPVLGFLAGGALIGPYALGIIQDVDSIRHLAELGVVFLLFNIGLELSFDRLRSMQKMVFGMGTAQVVTTLAAVAYTALALTGGAVGGPGAIILGGGLALSTTAVGMQVLQDRGETGSRHGRATFSVLLFQDLAVVVLLMLIPLLAPSPDAAAAGGAAGLMNIAKAIGVAGVKAVITMAAIVVAGRNFLRPIYRRVADTHNAEIFAATTLLVVIGTSLLTQIAGLSLALGAFLAGLLLAETEFHLQVESDIAPYKGLLMGLFFMTVGMEISFGLLFAKFRTIMLGITMLIAGKVAIMAAVGQAFGLTLVQSLRSGLLLAPGGEFAFVLFGEAVAKGIMGASLTKELYLVVALSMALTPFLAEFGQKIAKSMESTDMKALQPSEGETNAVSDHVIIAGFGRVGQMIAQMLSTKMIPFVALDVRTDRVQLGKEQDLPVYFGDAGSAAVLHAVGAERAACAVITLDTPSANYRSVWAMHKHFPNVRTFVRAFDISNGLVLEKAGATAVVPETLEPSLQLAAAVLSELNMSEDDVAETVRTFRKQHLADLQRLAESSGSSLGYGAASGSSKKEAEDGAAAGAAAAGSNGTGEAAPSLA